MGKRFSMHESESWIGYQLPRVFRLDNEMKIRWSARKGWTGGGWVKRSLVMAAIPVLYEPPKWGSQLQMQLMEKSNRDEE